MDSRKHTMPTGPFKFLIYSSKPYRLSAFLAVMFVVIASLSGVIVPYTFKRIIDVINGSEGIGPENIWFWAGVYVLVAFLYAMGFRGSGFSGLRWATGVRARGRELLTEHVTQHGQTFFSNHFAGAIGAKLKTASEGLKNMVETFLWDWLNFLVKLFVSVGLMWYTNPYIGMIFLLWIVLITPVDLFFVRRKVKLGIAGQEADTRLTANTVDVLTNIAAMHDYARRTFELARINKFIMDRRESGRKNWSYGEWMLTANSILETIFTGVIIFVSIYLWSKNFITPGDIVLVLTLVVALRSDLAHLGGNFNNSAEIIATVREGLSDILHPHEIVDGMHAKDLKITEGEIVFDNITFKYETREIFKNLSFRIEPGQRVGLIGRSGAGKSTLMKLLTRQYDIEGGAILIDGQDISEVKQESLREAIAVVPQDPLLFHRTLRENIAYGKLGATDEEVKVAAEQSQAHQFIDVLPKKYDTLVGERGVKLSGGERQRVAIARAFLKDAKILLLDEATSALDSESEKMIQAALEKLMEGKTVIAIAHRLSTLRAMDRLIVMDNGQIIENGTHEELIKLGGVYADLWSHQAGGFLKED
jgi:ATP-binding cassette, subfamily B, bacterial